MLTQDARQALTQLRGADPGTQSLGMVVLALAEEVERLNGEIEKLRRNAAAA